MTRKTLHGIEYCNDCRLVIGLMIDFEIASIRYNQLLRLCKKNIDQKYSPGRMERHLDGLEGKLIKRVQKKKQEVYYSVSFPENWLDFGKLILKKEVEKLNELPLDRLVRMKLHLYQIIGFEQNIADIECFLKIITPEERNLRVRLLGMMVEVKSREYDQAMNDRTESEYFKVLLDLKNERDKIKKED